MTTVLITGANRGIGLALTEVWLARGARVVATARQPERADGLERLRKQYSTLSVAPLDVVSEGACAELARRVDETIDILVNNAAVGAQWDRPQRLESLQFDKILETFSINTLGVLKVSQALLPRLASRGARIVNMTSQMGSIDDNSSGGAYDYRLSKAALNMATRNMAIELAPKETVVVAVHPGWVRTDMGGDRAPTDPATSAERIVSLTERLTMADSGKFFHAEGRPLPW